MLHHYLRVKDFYGKDLFSQDYVKRMKLFGINWVFYILGHSYNLFKKLTLSVSLYLPIYLSHSKKALLTIILLRLSPCRNLFTSFPRAQISSKFLMPLTLLSSFKQLMQLYLTTTQSSFPTQQLYILSIIQKLSSQRCIFASSHTNSTQNKYVNSTIHNLFILMFEQLPKPLDMVNIGSLLTWKLFKPLSIFLD